MVGCSVQAMQVCVGRVVCKPEVERFLTAIGENGDDPAAAESALEDLQAGIARYEVQAAHFREQARVIQEKRDQA